MAGRRGRGVSAQASCKARRGVTGDPVTRCAGRKRRDAPGKPCRRSFPACWAASRCAGAPASAAWRRSRFAGAVEQSAWPPRRRRPRRRPTAAGARTPHRWAPPSRRKSQSRRAKSCPRPGRHARRRTEAATAPPLLAKGSPQSLQRAHAASDHAHAAGSRAQRSARGATEARSSEVCSAVVRHGAARGCGA